MWYDPHKVGPHVRCRPLEHVVEDCQRVVTRLFAQTALSLNPKFRSPGTDFDQRRDSRADVAQVLRRHPPQHSRGQAFLLWRFRPRVLQHRVVPIFIVWPVVWLGRLEQLENSK